LSIRKKLIEVALPLEAINRESAREKSIRHGHPSTLHLWWARRPLAACRAVLFASLVDDPSSRPEEFPTEEAQEVERRRLFRLIEELVKWENTTNEQVLAAARAEILKSTGGNPPPVLDPFCGGGSIPLEAQRLGLEAHASDLNPVPVLITKALIEIPPNFVGMPPVNPESRKSLGHSGKWKGAAGLAEDVRYYGRWMRDEAERRIGHLYPKVKLSPEHGGGEATVIAWLWARTVTCPNPACGVQMPLVRSFSLSTKKGSEASVKPVIDRATQPPKIRFLVRYEKGDLYDGTVSRRGAKCLVCGEPVGFDHIRAEGIQQRMGAQLLAVVADGGRKRLYLDPEETQAHIAASAMPQWRPETQMDPKALGFRVPAYGLTKHSDLFTNRQLAVLTVFGDLVEDVRRRLIADMGAAGGKQALDGSGVLKYVDAVATYLGISASKSTVFSNSLARWRSGEGKSAPAFGRQAVAMVWDYTEINPFAGAGGDFLGVVNGTASVIDRLPTSRLGEVVQCDATRLHRGNKPKIISTDPPYYDNISYADLSDFFYVWLRRTLGALYPTLFGTLLTPKADELVAAPNRFDGDKAAAQAFFESGLEHAFGHMRLVQDPQYPLTVFYAFKQSESTDEEEWGEAGEIAISSTGWETMLEGLIRSGFLIDGTWPLRTEGSTRLRAGGSNALASSIVLVCRARSPNASSTTRREFLIELKRELPTALRLLQHGNIAPVDLAQAAIGPGMAIFSRYSRVLENDGSAMRVRTALALINQMLDELLSEQEGEFDADTRWALTWFDQHGLSEGLFGDANILATARNTSVDGLAEAGVVASSRGKVRLLKRDEMPDGWDPVTDSRVTVWESTHHLIRALEHGGEAAAARLLARLGPMGEVARDLAYRLYTTCERKGWSQEAQAYNALVVAWPEIAREAASAASSAPTAPTAEPEQPSLSL
jgi:putative DNA methylase